MTAARDVSPPGETLAEAALRALRERAGVQGLHPRQLRAFDDSQRDDRGWVLSVAHVDVVPFPCLGPSLQATEILAPVDVITGLAFSHHAIV